MKKLVIVSTDYRSGHGGMQTALSGYIDGLDELEIDYIFIESHNENDVLFLKWFGAFAKILQLVVQNKSSELVFWFHCGPWLSLFRKASLAIIPRLAGATVIAHIHSYSTYRYLQKGFSRRYVKFLLGPFTDLVVLSEWWRQLFIRHNINKLIKVSPNPVSRVHLEQGQSNHSNAAQTSHDATVINMLSMGRLIPGKGFEVLVDVMAKLPDQFRLTIAGDGVLKQALEAQVNQLQLADRVHFTGWVTGHEKADILNHATMFVLPSNNDAFGMIYIEAMAYGLPVVALDFGPVKDMITKDVGLLCAEQTPQSVKQTIEHISANLADFQGGKLKIVELYQPAKSAANIIQYLN